jgi:succinate dehydrogenase flavin-adding protein (antitoxin of CptAB toxin-antitoxin module)
MIGRPEIDAAEMLIEISMTPTNLLQNTYHQTERLPTLSSSPQQTMASRISLSVRKLRPSFVLRSSHQILRFQPCQLRNLSLTYRLSQSATSPDPYAHELKVGELEGGKFRVEPLRRTGEDISTMRSRLQYQSRKRGILETDLLLSTFADANLSKLELEDLKAYDLFLDENDWDIYYWATQEPPATSIETAEGAVSTSKAVPDDLLDTSEVKDTVVPARENDGAGEWAQTIGKFKPAYRPVPSRWKDSKILGLLRDHVVSRSGAAPKQELTGSGTGPAKTADAALAGSGTGQGKSGGGLGRMPDVKQY